MMNVGRVRDLRRYPVKSMGGEAVGRCRITAVGIPGDRVWALRDEAAGEIRGAKKFPRLLLCRARSLEAPRSGGAHAVEIELPDGRRLQASAPEISEELSRLLGRDVTLCPLRSADDADFYRRGMPDKPDLLEELRDIFGREEGEPLPDLGAFPSELMEFTSPRGTFFDAFAIHFVTTASLDEMRRLSGGADFAPGRFRPNFVLETSPEAGTGLVETTWTGRRLRIGSATLRIAMPAVRCGMIAKAHADSGLGEDARVLRAVVRDGDQNFGAYAEVVEAGDVGDGDEAVLLD